MKNISKRFLILSILFILAIPVAYAINTISEGFKNTPGSSQVIDAHGVCEKVVNGTSDKTYFVPTKTSEEWQAFRDNIPTGVSLDDCIQTINLVVNSDTPNYNIANAAGNPSDPVNVILTNNATIYSTNTGAAALTTGSFANGSTVTIVNNGSIVGAGGAGGAGAYVTEVLGAGVNATNGGDGGDAISLQYNVIIDNTNGNIYGGGGGGGGGAAGTGPAYGGGGGGGGGAGGSVGGNGGTGLGAGTSGDNGSSGDVNGAGAGGAGGSGSGVTGNGGNGGGYGNDGVNGGTGSWLNFGYGGGAGNAVRRNGFSASITGGTVLGAVN